MNPSEEHTKAHYVFKGRVCGIKAFSPPSSQQGFVCYLGLERVKDIGVGHRRVGALS